MNNINSLKEKISHIVKSNIDSNNYDIIYDIYGEMKFKIQTRVNLKKYTFKVLKGIFLWSSVSCVEDGKIIGTNLVIFGLYGYCRRHQRKRFKQLKNDKLNKLNSDLQDVI